MMSGYLLCKSLAVWNAQRRTDLDQARNILEEGKHAFEVLSKIYARSLNKKNVVENDEMKEFFKQINDEVCGRCYLKTNCWEIYTGRTEQYIKQLFKCAENGEDGYDNNADRRNGFLCENRLAMSSLDVYKRQVILRFRFIISTLRNGPRVKEVFRSVICLFRQFIGGFGLRHFLASGSV